MALPEFILEEIVEALVSAYPEEDELLQMLRFKFNMGKSELPHAFNYKTTIFKLVEKFESKDQIIKLIQKAYNHNSGNLELSTLYKQLSQINLIEILYSLERKDEKYLNLMSKTYEKCLTDKNLSDWRPESLEEIYKYLQQIKLEDKSGDSFVNFVSKLLVEKSLPLDIRERLEKWHKDNTNIIDNVFKKIQTSINLKKEQRKASSFLMILIRSSQQKNTRNCRRYLIDAWFAINEGQCQIKYEPLEVPDKAVFLDKIPSSVENIIKQMNIKINTTYIDVEQPMIMFFIPHALFNEPLDFWKYEGRSIGSLYQVAVRSLKRLEKDYGFKIIWRNKWDTFQQQINDLNCYAFVSSNCQKLFASLKKDTSIGLKSTKAINEKIIDDLHNTGTPVAIWLRHCPNNIIDYEAEFNALLKCKVCDLPSSVSEKRAEVVDIEDKNSHIGHHLSLLWENPYILPPEALPGIQP